MQSLSLIQNEVAVPAESFVKFNGYFKEGMIPKTTYDNWVNRGKIITEKACNGKKAMVMYKSIPEDKRKLVWEYLFDRDRDALFDLYDVPEGWLRQIFPNFEQKKSEVMKSKGKELECLSDKELAIAQARYNLVKYMRDYVGVGNYGSALKNREEFVERYNNQLIHENIYEVIGKASLKTFYRWEKIIKEKGDGNKIEVLAPSYRTSAKNRSRIQITKEEEALCKRFWTQSNKPSISSVCRDVVKELDRRGRMDICSDYQIRKFLEQWAKNNNATAIYIREGEKALKDKILPYIERDNKLLNFMDVIVADGHTLNFEVKNPKTGHGVRPTVITWVDMRTLMVLGWEVMLTENTKAVVSSLRNAMLNAGKLLGFQGKGIVPKVTYTDNGRAFKNKYFKGKGEKIKGEWHEEFDGLFDRLKPFGFIKGVYALPYNAQSKVNERIFGTMLEFEKQQLSFVGKNIEDKPARMMRNEKTHRNEYTKLIEKVGLPTLQEVYFALGKWFEEYNNRISNGRYLDGKSPFEEMLTCYQEAEKRTIDIEALHYMMLEQKEVKLYREGIKFMGNWYNSLALSQQERGNWEFRIKYDMMNMDSIGVYRDNGEFLCDAVKQIRGIHPMAELLGSDVDKENYNKAVEQKKSFVKHSKQVVKEFIGEENSDMMTIAPAYVSNAIETKQEVSQLQPVVEKEEDFDFLAIEKANPVLDDLLEDILDKD